MTNKIYKQMLIDYKAILRLIEDDLSPIEYAHMQKKRKNQGQAYDSDWVDRCDFLEKVEKNLKYTDPFYKKDKPVYIIMDKYGHGKINETNKIYVFLDEMTSDDFKRVFGLSLPNGIDSEKIDLYADLENTSKRLIIPSDEKESFEKNNKIIYGKSSIYDFSDRYFNARYAFFKKCLESSEEEAINLMFTPLYNISNRPSKDEEKELENMKLLELLKKHIHDND